MLQRHLCSRGLPWRAFASLIGACSVSVACSADSGGPADLPTGGMGGDATGGVPSTGGLFATGGDTSGFGGTAAAPTGGLGATAGSGGGAGTGGAGMGGGGTGGAAASGGLGGTGSTMATGGESLLGGSAGTGSTMATGGEPLGGSAGTGSTMATGGESASGGTGTGGVTAVVPTMVSDSDWQFDVPSCDMVLDVNPQIGARVTSLSVGGTDIIVPFSCATYDGSAACNGSGSTFWTSPQSDWSWPPVEEIDGGAYAASVSDDHLLLTGSISSSLGAGADKDISVDAGSCTITLVYTIKTNRALSLAPWEISRVPRGGLAVFPAGSSMENSSELTVSEVDGHVWLDDSTQTTVVSEGPKIIADGSGGWLAYVLNGYAFLKFFDDVPAANLAPGEGDVEIYPGSGYLELEPQGAYSAIAANASTDWTVRWRVVAIPSTVTVGVGSTTLIEFVEQQAAL